MWSKAPCKPRVIWVRVKVEKHCKEQNFQCREYHASNRTALERCRGLCCEVHSENNEMRAIEEQQQERSWRSYAKLKPVQDASGKWVVGERLTRYNAMTPDSSLQRLLPSKHSATCLFMDRAHQAGGHRRRDATLPGFQMRYWMPQGSKVARLVKMDCQLCKLHNAKFLKQPMGLLPEARLKPAPAFNHVMLDLFGPYTV